MKQVNIDESIIKVLYAMQSVIGQNELEILKATLYAQLGRLHVFEEETALSTAMDDNNNIINLFIATLSIEGRTNSTIKAYAQEYKMFFSLVDKNIRDVTTNDIRMYLAHCKTTRKNSDVTLNNRIRNLKSLFAWLTTEDYIDKDPLRKINVIKTETRIKETISEEQEEIVRCACDRERDTAIINLLTSTGMRVGELVKLNRSDIDLVNKECIVYGKGRKERTSFFDGRAKVHLVNYLETREDDNEALFVSIKKPYSRLTTDAVRRIVNRVANNSNENIHVHPHKFRRTMATNMIERGAPVEFVQKILGHANIETTLKCYAVMSNAIIKDAHRRYS
ncbi:tyrosine-type recombinase/integrase [Anaerosporobacter sp.]|uniref:tyrosine-type recombinase/integrase n=1 Tax=Anaerosporobacter sp. TaxID=1872529 RepID=UPI00286F5E79|nr:tyrosine-type recombinase/integrase [Anaerosporobacter sp.]